MQPSTAVDDALEAFVTETTRLREALDQRRLGVVSGPAAETAADIVAFTGVLQDTWVQTASAIEAETAAIASALGPIDWDPDPERVARAAEIHAAAWPGQDIRRLLACYKAWFYFARIYQDILYDALNRTILGSVPGGPSMGNALKKETNPVRVVLQVIRLRDIAVGLDQTANVAAVAAARLLPG
jgi:hypothetical protein